MRTSTVWYVADFETTSEAFYKQYGFTQVWLYSICDMEGNIVEHGYSIDDFMGHLSNYRGKTIYFHNEKFDGSFILDWLLKNGFEYHDDLKKVERGFTCLVGEQGEFYSIDIKTSAKIQVHIHDSLKLLPFKVEKLAKDFNMPIKKLSIDYNDYTITPEKIEYVDHDVKIVAMALKHIKAQGMTKMTTASCAYHQYTSTKTLDYLEYCFPELDTDFLERYRGAYRGGRTQVNPKYARRVLHNVKRYDINSMYPYVMANMPLPYGHPVKCTEPGNFKFELYKVAIGFTLKPKHMPSLLRKGSIHGGVDTYYESTDDIEIMYISSIDLELVKRHYDIYHLEYLEIWGFYTTTILFNDYVNYWYEKKNSTTGAEKIVCKLMLNSLYGKFGTNVKKARKTPYIKEDGSVGFTLGEPQEGKHYYLPVAIAITSWAHWLIDNAIVETGVDNFVYCDTDSVHTLGDLPADWVDNKKLGKFKLEAIEEHAKYVRQKCYITYEDDKWHITCAGMPDQLKEIVIAKSGTHILNDFDIGLRVFGKLLPKRVPGGTILYETTFEIR